LIIHTYIYIYIYIYIYMLPHDHMTDVKVNCIHTEIISNSVWDLAWYWRNNKQVD